MNVEHEDVVCRMFTYTFENKASMWYYNLPIGSIRSLDAFERTFLNNFGEDKTPATLRRELIVLKM
jgi:hypothetical protein